MKRIGVFSTLSIIATGLALLTGYFVWEPSNVEPGSLVYKLKIPAVVREFPVWQPSNTPIYRSRVADGEKPSFYGLNYHSALEAKRLRELLIAKTFTCQLGSGAQVLCKRNNNDGSLMEVMLMPVAGTGATKVEIGFIDY